MVCHLHLAFTNFNDFIEEHDLKQMITLPTQVHGSTLDLLFTSNTQNILDVNVREPFTSTCDNNMIEFKINLSSLKPPTQHPNIRFLNHQPCLRNITSTVLTTVKSMPCYPHTIGTKF